jgi:hypothetical protein
MSNSTCSSHLWHWGECEYCEELMCELCRKDLGKYQSDCCGIGLLCDNCLGSIKDKMCIACLIEKIEVISCPKNGNHY